jgi:hypothetical protein
MFSFGNSSFQLDSAAGTFNNYFLNTTEKVNTEKVDTPSDLLFHSNLSAHDFPDMTTIPITDAEIISTFAVLKNKSSSVYDATSNRILKFRGIHLGTSSAYFFINP